MTKETAQKLLDAVSAAGFEVTEVKDEYSTCVATSRNYEAYEYFRPTGAITLRVMPEKKDDEAV